MSDVSLTISFGLNSNNEKKINECINFHFVDEKGNNIFTSLTKEQLLCQFTEKLR
jgi:hypothetical protein